MAHRSPDSEHWQDRVVVTPRSGCVRAVAFATAIGVVCALPQHAAAQKACDKLGKAKTLMVTEVFDKTVELFADPYGSEDGNPQNREAVLKAKIDCEADNGMFRLRNKTGGVLGWVYPHEVETDDDVVIKSRCLKTASGQKVGATRGVGEDCPK